MKFNQTSISALRQVLLVIDRDIFEYEKLLSWVSQEVELLILSANGGEVEQINQAIAHRLNQPNHPPISSIHIVAHGAPGSLQLGNTDLSLKTLDRYAWNLQTWFADLPGTMIPSLVLYGCNVAVGDAGTEFLEKLHHLTGASVRASRTPVGHASLGGNWDLDRYQGSVEPSLIFDAQVADAYAGILPTYTDGDSYYRVIDSNTDTFVDISGTGTRIAKMTDQNSSEPKFDANDDGEQGLDLPFTFNYYGTNYNTLTVGVNGGLILGTKEGVVSPTHAELPIKDTQTQDPIPAIFPFWTDLQLTIGGAGDVYYQTFGTPGQQTFVVQWNNIVHKEVNDGVTFQVVLHEGSNEVTFAYQDTSFNNTGYDDGKVATVGLSGGTIAKPSDMQYSKDETKLSGTKTIRFAADPRLVNNAIAISESQALTLTPDHLLASDFDAVNGATITYTISNLQHGHFESSGGTTVTSFTQDDITNGRIKLIHDNGENAPSFDFTLSDQHPESVPSQAIAAQITFTSVNDAPLLGNVNANLSLQENTINNGATLIDADVTLSDPDSPNFNGGQLLVTYTSAKGIEDQLGIRTDGLVSLINGIVYYNSTAIGTVNELTNGENGKNLAVLFNNNANATNVEAVIENLTYQNVSNTPQANRSVKIEVTDGDSGTSTAQSVAIAVTANNDAPVVTVPDTSSTPLALDEDQVLTFTGAQLISIADVDAGTSPVRVTLTATDGIVTLGSLSNVTIKNGSNNSATVTLEGTVANLNAALNNTKFTPSTNFNGDATVTIEVNDQGNSGTPLTPLTDQAVINIAVKAINDAPINTVPLAQTVDEDTNLVFSGAKLISIADTDVNESVNPTMKVTLSVNHGTLTLSQTTDLNFISGASGESSMQMVGTVGAINAALNGLIYRGVQDFNGTDELTITTSDQGNTSAEDNELIDIDTIAITVDPINDAPVNTTPTTTQTVDEDTNLVFNSTHSNAISVTDVDALQENKNLQVTLSVNNGILTLNGTNGLTFSTGDGTQDKSIRFTGLVANINAALSGLIYRGDVNFDGTDTLTISTSDLGNVGKSGIIKNDIKTVAIDLTSVNDAPTVSGFAQSITFNEQDVNAAFQVLDNSVNLNDVDSADFDQGLLTVTSNAPSEDRLSIQNQGTSTGQIGVSGTTITYGGTQIGTINADGSSGTLQISLSNNANAPAVEALLKNLTYKNVSDTPVSDRTLSFELKDGDGGTTSFSSNVTVTAANDAPILSKNLLQINEDQTLTLNGNNLVATDVDSNDTELTFVVANLQHGTFLVDKVAANEFTQQQLLDNKVEFKHDGGEDAPYYEIRVKDEANLTVAQAATITFIKVNDAPTVSGFAQLITFNEQNVNTAFQVLDSSVNLNDVDSANFDQGLLTVTSNVPLEDRLSIQNQGTSTGQIGLSGTIVTYGGTQIGTVNGNADGSAGTLQVSLNTNATIEAVEALLKNLTYKNISDTPVSDRTLSFELKDGDGGTTSFSSNVTVTAANDAPVLNKNLLQINEGKTLTLNANNLVATDVDSNENNLTFVVANPQNGVFLVDGNELVAGVDVIEFTQQQLLDNKVEFKHDGGEDAPYYEIRVKDEANLTVAQAATITFIKENDAPTLSGLTNLLSLSGTQATQNPNLIDTDVSFTDIDSLNLGGGYVNIAYSAGGGLEDQLSVQTQTTPSNSTIRTGNQIFFGSTLIGLVDGTQTGINGQALQINLNSSATVAAVQALIQGLTYQNTSSTPTANRTLTVTVNDGSDTSEASQVLVTIAPENDPPEITAPTLVTTNEDEALTLSNGSAISVDDPDAGDANPIKVKLTATKSTLTLSGTTGLTFSQGDGTADATMTFQGTIVNINNALAGLVVSPNANANGSATIQVDLDDLGNTGGGGPKTASQTISLDITAINDRPQIAVLGNQAVNEDTDLVFDGSNRLTISDVDADGEIVQASLSVTNGLLTLNGDVNGLDILEGTEINSTVVGKTLVVKGTVADINGAMENMLYRADANFNGSDTLSIAVDDLGNTGEGGALQVQRNVVIAVGAVNDAPINMVPSLQTVKEEATLAFSSNLGNALSINDLDLDEVANSAQVTLAVTSGLLTLAQTAGLSFLSGDGTTDAAMTFVGTPDAINAAMNGLTYQGNQNFFGTDTLKITTNDRGNSGSGGVLIDVDEVAIRVENVNDAPVISGEPAVSVVEGQVYSFIPTVGDADGDRLTFSVLNKPAWATLNPNTGELSGNPLEADIGVTSDIIIQVSDGVTTTNLAPFSLTVLDSKIRGGTGSDAIAGSGADDIILGLDGNDSIAGGDGNDTIYGDVGEDQILGENGNDTIYGGDGNDILYGGNGADILYGELGDDQLFGESGRDTLYGGPGKDLLSGGLDNDRIYGAEDNDKIFGDDGDDLLIGEAGNDKLNGGRGNDRILGVTGNDKLIGGSEDDILDGGQGKDRLKGGTGKDTFVFNRKGLGIVLDYDDGNDKLAVAGTNARKLFGRNISLSERGRHTLIEYDNRIIGALVNTDSQIITRNDFVPNP